MKALNLLYIYFCFRIFIGIKKLLALIDMTRQIEDNFRVMKFLTKLEEDGGLDCGTSVQ